MIREKQDFHAKYVVSPLPMSEVLRPKSSNLIVGIVFANIVVPSHGGIGL